ncbi:MAG: NAD-dependent epimerase/dehydratase family protein, partial [Alcaligenaceae bacterium]
MMSTVLVTGGSGFLASHCILSLLNHGYSVRATVRSLQSAERTRQMLASTN